MVPFIRTILAAAALAAASAPAVAQSCQKEPNFTAWLAGVRAEAVAGGLSRAAVDGALAGVVFDPAIVQKDRGQAVFTQDYLTFANRMVADYRLKQGAANLTKYAATFAKIESNLRASVADMPTWREAAWPLMATPGLAGDLWFRSREGRLFHSTDGGKNFSEVATYMNIEALGFGKAPEGGTYPALFAYGWSGQTRAIMRSDDVGVHWLRINDASHEYGRRFRCITGDPRIFGRVYVGTDGRGILYGDPNPP